MSNTFLKLYNEVSDLWNEQKALSWTRNKKEKERIIIKLEKKVEAINKIVATFENEFEFLREFHDLAKKVK